MINNTAWPAWLRRIDLSHRGDNAELPEPARDLTARGEGDDLLGWGQGVQRPQDAGPPEAVRRKDITQRRNAQSSRSG